MKTVVGIFILALLAAGCVDQEPVSIERDDVLAAVVNRVPKYHQILVPDELGAVARKLQVQYPEIIQLDTVRRGNGGEPVYCMHIGDGSRHILLYAYPTAAEPFGGLALAYLARSLAEDELFRSQLDVSWHLVLCASPDDGLQNESWYKTPFSLTDFARGFSGRLATPWSGELSNQALGALEQICTDYDVDLAIGFRAGLFQPPHIASNKVIYGAGGHFHRLMELKGFSMGVEGIGKFVRTSEGSLDKWADVEGQDIDIVEVFLPFVRALPTQHQVEGEELPLLPDRQELLAFLDSTASRTAELLTAESSARQGFPLWLEQFRQRHSESDEPDIHDHLTALITLGQLVQMLEQEQLLGVQPFPTLLQQVLDSATQQFETYADVVESRYAYTVSSLQNMVKTYLALGLYMGANYHQTGPELPL